MLGYRSRERPQGVRHRHPGSSRRRSELVNRRGRTRRRAWRILHSSLRLQPVRQGGLVHKVAGCDGAIRCALPIVQKRSAIGTRVETPGHSVPGGRPSRVRGDARHVSVRIYLVEPGWQRLASGRCREPVRDIWTGSGPTRAERAWIASPGRHSGWRIRLSAQPLRKRRFVYEGLRGHATGV